jgi:sialic acid synthase SpsE
MATMEELDQTVRTARESGCEELILLKCTSSYPAKPEETNLATIPHLKEHFGTEVGVSDHTMGIGVAIAGVSLGATVIEKHFTLARADGGVDSEFSMEPHEMKLLVKESLKAWQALGKVFYGPTETEKRLMIYRRSIYAVKEIKEGEFFTAENIRIIRPGDGLEPKYYESLLCKSLVN